MECACDFAVCGYQRYFHTASIEDRGIGIYRIDGRETRLGVGGFAYRETRTRMLDLDPGGSGGGPENDPRDRQWSWANEDC